MAMHSINDMPKTQSLLIKPSSFSDFKCSWEIGVTSVKISPKFSNIVTLYGRVNKYLKSFIGKNALSILTENPHSCAVVMLSGSCTTDFGKNNSAKNFATASTPFETSDSNNVQDLNSNVSQIINADNINGGFNSTIYSTWAQDFKESLHSRLFPLTENTNNNKSNTQLTSILIYPKFSCWISYSNQDISNQSPLNNSYIDQEPIFASSKTNLTPFPVINILASNYSF
ncbi:hypothetical protein AYI70_g11367 [Smittium culicis]|uniref:Uncharacterized protein n=1 Tax=Smittium culicis TaxID=133412 RepID=A0A1R1X263_9FUNG|nr:hypothetical protein AYI70_g11367 [Smittium culicis]